MPNTLRFKFPAALLVNTWARDWVSSRVKQVLFILAKGICSNTISHCMYLNSQYNKNNSDINNNSKNNSKKNKTTTTITAQKLFVSGQFLFLKKGGWFILWSKKHNHQCLISFRIYLANWFMKVSDIDCCQLQQKAKTSPQAKRHKLSLHWLFKLSSIDNFYP